MTKAELIEKVADKASEKKNTVEKIINDAIEVVMYEVTRGEAVQLIGFGTFKLSDRQACKGRNPRTGEDPRTGEEIDIPAHKSPTFKAGKSFVDMVKESSNEIY